MYRCTVIMLLRIVLYISLSLSLYCCCFEGNILLLIIFREEARQSFVSIVYKYFEKNFNLY